jgi:hypothetical protein
MMNVKSMWVALVMGSALFGQAVKPNLLPTEVVAKKIAAIQRQLLDANNKLDLPTRERQVEHIKSLVTEFVIAQLEAEPRLEWWQLRWQVAQLMPRPYESDPCVFQVWQPSADDPTVWGVAYMAYAAPGMGGSRIVVESYVVEAGKARLAGRAGSEMNGQVLKAEPIWNPLSNSLSIFGYGTFLMGSGHVLPSAAVLYTVSPVGVRAVWKFNSPGIEFGGSVGDGFSIYYHDEKRDQKNLPHDGYDVYSIGEDGVPKRVVHRYR